MITEFVDVSETQKTLTIEVPTAVVDAEIDRVASGYSKQAKIPGFRPGKVPKTIVKQRFREQILHDVMHDLVPRAVTEALQERGIEPIDTPSIKDVHLHEGAPLTFTAAVETLPAFDPGDVSTIEVARPAVGITDEAVEQSLQQLRERAAKFEPVEGRPVTDGDTLVADLARTDVKGEKETHDGVSIEIGSEANPPGFDANLIGMNAGEARHFTVQFPEGYPVAELANSELVYDVTVKEIRHKSVPELDDEFAKDVGDFDSLEALRARIRADMEAEAAEHAQRHVRTEVLKQLSQRISFDVPASLIEREMDRRIEEFARQLMAQRIDPRQAGIDWAHFRESQREAAREAVAGGLVLDEIARREALQLDPQDVDKEIEQFALQAGRTPAALRAQLEKDGGISRLYAGLRREKAVDLVMSRARITGE